MNGLFLTQPVLAIALFVAVCFWGAGVLAHMGVYLYNLAFADTRSELRRTVFDLFIQAPLWPVFRAYDLITKYWQAPEEW